MSSMPSQHICVVHSSQREETSREDATEKNLHDVPGSLRAHWKQETKISRSLTSLTVSMLLWNRGAAEKRRNVKTNGIINIHGDRDYEDRDGDVYGSCLTSSLPSTTTTGLDASNSYHAKNDLNKRYRRRPLLPTMKKTALGARTRYLPMIRCSALTVLVISMVGSTLLLSMKGTEEIIATTFLSLSLALAPPEASADVGRRPSEQAH